MRTIPIWAPWLAGLAVVIALVAPRQSIASVVGLMAVAAGSLVATKSEGVAGRLWRMVSAAGRWQLGLALALAAFLVLNSIRAPDPINSLGKTGLVLVLLLAVITFAACISDATERELDGLAAGLLIAFGASLVYLLIEEVSGHRIKSWVFNVIPALRPHPRHLMADGDIVQGVHAYYSNRSVAVMVLLTFPALLLLMRLVPSRRIAIAAGLGLAAVVAVVALQSAHASSRLALAGGLATVALAMLVPRRAVWVAIAVWLALWILVLPTSKALYTAGLHLDERIPYSFRARIILWNYTADQIPNRPLLGVGVDGTKPLDQAREKTWETRPGHVYPQRTAEHAHNIYLQLWYELGLIGVLLVAGAGVALINGVRQRPSSPLVFATMMATALLLATSWGLWQPWLLGAIAVSSILLVVGQARELTHAVPRPAGDPAPDAPAARATETA